jgi:HSP20 family protein
MLVPWQPFLEPFENFEKFFGKNSPVGVIPAIDIYEKGKDIIVETTLAGIDPEKVEISIENDVLTLQGKMEKKTEVEDKNYYRKEISTGSFYRQVPLPKPVVGDKAAATYENGVLKIAVPKAPEKKLKKIDVKIIKNKK